MTAAADSINMALFCDFENVALGVRDAKYDKFDIKPVLERLLLKGSIVVKKAYCDWDRYKSFKATMHEANFELIEIPHLRLSGKNSADIRLVVDALDLCYTKSHVDTFVIISGDSDFSPLVSKLRENAKQVIGVGVKQSTSDLLIANCDEFIFYDDLVRERQRSARREVREPSSAGKRSNEDEGQNKQELEARRSEAIQFAVATFDDLMAERGDGGKIWASMLKQAMKRRRPHFNESYCGFRVFGNLLDEAQTRGLLTVGRDEKSGSYVQRGALSVESGNGSLRQEVMEESSPPSPMPNLSPGQPAPVAARPVVDKAVSKSVDKPSRPVPQQPAMKRGLTPKVKAGPKSASKVQAETLAADLSGAAPAEQQAAAGAGAAPSQEVARVKAPGISGSAKAAEMMTTEAATTEAATTEAAVTETATAETADASPRAVVAKPVVASSTASAGEAGPVSLESSVPAVAVASTPKKARTAAGSKRTGKLKTGPAAEVTEQTAATTAAAATPEVSSRSTVAKKGKSSARSTAKSRSKTVAEAAELPSTSSAVADVAPVDNASAAADQPAGMKPATKGATTQTATRTRKKMTPEATPEKAAAVAPPAVEDAGSVPD